MKSRWRLVSLLCSLVLLPAIAHAQVTKEQADNFVDDILRALATPNWNLFVQGGWANSDRFAIQHVVGTPDGQRALRTSTGYNVGGGVGVDILVRMGFRAYYSFSSADLNYRTDDGTGSRSADVDGVATIKTNTVALEVMRYMLPSRSSITPYGTLGIQGTWWGLDENSNLIANPASATPFSVGPLFSFGVSGRIASRFSARIEVALSSHNNPFTGRDSFLALSGPTVDEPSGVGHTEYRLAGVYHFSKR